MNAPMKSVFDMQLMAVQTMSAAFAQALEFWSRMFEVQMGSLRVAAGDRRTHAEIAKGPALTDHYGKREHDIDPERDV